MNAISGVVELARPLDFSNANTIGITVIAEVCVIDTELNAYISIFLIKVL